MYSKYYKTYNLIFQFEKWKMNFWYANENVIYCCGLIWQAANHRAIHSLLSPSGTEDRIRKIKKLWIIEYHRKGKENNKNEKRIYKTKNAKCNCSTLLDQFPASTNKQQQPPCQSTPLNVICSGWYHMVWDISLAYLGQLSLLCLP